VTIHFISGLPRSGSTLLAALLRQNPAFRASVSTPLWEMFTALLQKMNFSDGRVAIPDDQRTRILKGLVEAYYAGLPPETVVFDTHRGWSASLSALCQLFPDTRVICCVRSPAWILDSVEQLVARNPLRISRMFDPRAGANVYQRMDAMMAKDGFVGMPLANLRQAWYSDQAARVIAIRYDSLANQPAAVMSGLYQALGIAEFPHNFERVEYEEDELDARVNMPGLHTVAGRVEPRKRVTVLPPELFKQSDHSFWDAPGQNPRGVTVL
jgi:sulfotransferase